MRRQVVLVALATTAMVAIAFVVPLGLLVRTFARDRALAAAEAEARALAPALALTDDRAVLLDAVVATEAGARGRMGVLLPDGRRVGRQVAPDATLAAARRGRALTVRTAGGARVLVPVVLGDRGAAVVTVDVPRAVLERGVTRSWAILAGLAVALVAAAVAVAYRLARGLARPVERLAEAAAAIGAGDLDARTEPEGPTEVAGVARAFNVMAERVSQLLAAERELVADLSHRLRTPLTRLRLDAEALSGEASGRDLVADVDALEAEVDALIAEARRPVRPTGTADAAEVVSDRVALWSALAADEGRRWSTSTDGGPFLVPVPAAELAAAVDALLGNVLAHTAEGTGFAVSVCPQDGLTAVIVDDAGQGFPPTATTRGVSGSGSTGLGLDIARRTAQAAGGRMEVGRSPLGGARVVLLLPPAHVGRA